MKLERERKPHRCSIKPEPPPVVPPGWIQSLDEWRREFQEYYAKHSHIFGRKPGKRATS